MRQLDYMVASLASGSRHLLQQHGLIPDLVDKLQDAAQNRTQIAVAVAATITGSSNDLNVLRFILGIDLWLDSILVYVSVIEGVHALFMDVC